MRIFVDLDGTLAKWENVEFEQLYEKGYFRNLTPNRNIIKDVNNLLNNGYDVYVLSAYLTDSKYALEEKKEWVAEYLPTLSEKKQLYVPFGSSKTDFFEEHHLMPITDKDFLIDDYTPNLVDWQTVGGVGIKYLNGINHTHKTWQGEMVDYSEDFRSDTKHLVNILEKGQLKMENSRKLYLEFLKDEVKKYCNNEGYYKLYWDYRDTIAPDLILEAARKWKQNGMSSVEDYLTETICEDYLDFAASEFEFTDMVLKDLCQRGNEHLLDECKKSYSLSEDLEEVGYQGLDINLTDLLELTTINVNIMFSTAEEENRDMTNILTCFGNGYLPPKTNTQNIDNALAYLVFQQGYSVEDVLSCLEKNPRGFSDKECTSFIKSVVNDVVNSSSEYRSELTALIKLTGADILKFFNTVENKEKFLSLGTDTDIGLFNEWEGSGSLLEIQLDKPFVVPCSMIRNIQIEGATKENYGYTVNEVYSLVGSCWKDSLEYKEDAPDMFFINEVQNDKEPEI